MENFEETVHIVPLGYEYDRAVKPFMKVRVDRVYLITIDPARYTGPKAAVKNEKQDFYDNKVKNKLLEMGISVEIIRVDMFDVLSVLQCISSVIIKERSSGNRIFLNMSACGRLTSVAATLAAMAHDVTAYYVWADGYAESREEEENHGLSMCENARIRTLEALHIARPDPVSEILLVELYRHEKGMTTEDIISFLHERGIVGFQTDYKQMDYNSRRRHQINSLMRLNKGTLSRLERDGHITRKKAGRHTIVSITESGRYLASISGLIKGSHRYDT